MKIKTDQMAVIQALRESLEEIPFLKVLNSPALVKVSSPDFQVKIRIKNRSLTLLADYKSSGQPRIARQSILQIKKWLSEGRGDYGLFTAPYISPDAAKICKDAGIGYVDLAGNSFLSFETIYVSREGKPNPSVQRRELRSLYSPKAERILRALLSRSQQGWKTASLADAAQVSFGQVANVKKYLADREWLVPNENGIRLSAPSALLDEWATQYRFTRNQVVDYYTLSEMAECEYQLAEACQRLGIRYALTAFSAAARLAPVVRYQRAIAYVEGDPDAVANSLGLKPVTTGSNISLLIPYDEGVFFENQSMEGAQVVSPIQIYLDLQNYRGRGQEAAQAIRRVIERSW